MYGGETYENYNQYDYANNTNTIFDDKQRSKDEVILGIESSFDDSAAALINSFGWIKSQESIQQWD
jgi:hypothetical protein